MHADDDENADKGTGFVTRAFGVPGSHPVATGFLCGMLAFAVWAWGAFDNAGTQHRPDIDIPVPALTQSAQKPEGKAAPQTQPPVTARPVANSVANPVLAVAQPVPPKIVGEAALVLTDVGLSRRLAEAIGTTMPHGATIAVSAYANDPSAVAAAFKKAGFDVWLHVATQSTTGGIDPGPLAISRGLGGSDNAALLKRQIDAAGKNIIGLFLAPDADIVASGDAWNTLAADVIAQGLLVMDGTPDKVATSLYMQRAQSKIPAYIKTDATDDGSLPPEALVKALDATVPLILQQQQAIVVVAHPAQQNIAPLAQWAQKLESKGIRLVPASRFSGLKP